MDVDPADRLLSGDVAAHDKNLTDSEILRSTAQIYGGISAFAIVVFIIVRRKYPSVYNVRGTLPEWRDKRATDDVFGVVSWMWKVFRVPYDDMIEQSGMDAAATVRIMEFGAKLSFVAMANSVYLFPIYAMGNALETDDPVTRISLSNVPVRSNGTIATVFSAYVFFFAAMYLTVLEFRFFTAKRHRFLSTKRPDNYTVFISHLPPELQSDEALARYFRKCFDRDSVVESRVVLSVPCLEKKVAARKALEAKLEHAINVSNVLGYEPTHRTSWCNGKTVKSIDAYTDQLEKLNDEISEAITKIELWQASEKSNALVRNAKTEAWAIGNEDRGANTTISATMDVSFHTSASAGERYGMAHDVEGHRADEPHPAVSDKLKRPENMSTVTVAPAVEVGAKRPVASDVRSKATVDATSKHPIERGGSGGDDDEVRPRDAAFVSFAELMSANLARQAMHSPEPHMFEVQEPPRPEDVDWNNVTISHKSKQARDLLGFTLTAALCIVWSVPVTVFASMPNAEALSNLLSFLKPVLQDHDRLAALLAQLAPLLLVGFLTLLPFALLEIGKLEGHTTVMNFRHPSLFTKLAIFTILHTFFISTIAGCVTSKLYMILTNPTLKLKILSRALPEEATFFMQIIFVQTMMGGTLEILRVVPLAYAVARHVLGILTNYNLTEKERNTPMLGLRPLNDPEGYPFVIRTGQKYVLNFMVLFVYGSMAPLSAHISFVCFVLLAMILRNQFLFVYRPMNDSGGKLWLSFMKTIIVCMILAQFVLLGALILKGGIVAAPLMVLLVVVTILFNVYVNRRHYFVTRYLPTGICMRMDRSNGGAAESFDFLRSSYLQPALKTIRVIYPENFPEEKRKWR